MINCKVPDYKFDAKGCNNAAPVTICNVSDLALAIATASTAATVPAPITNYPVSNFNNTPLQVTLTNPADKELVMLYTAENEKVLLTYDVTVAPPSLVSIFNLSTNTAYTKPLSTLASNTETVFSSIDLYSVELVPNTPVTVASLVAEIGTDKLITLSVAVKSGDLKVTDSLGNVSIYTAGSSLSFGSNDQNYLRLKNVAFESTMLSYLTVTYQAI